MIFAIGYFVCAIWNAIVSMIDYNQHKRTWVVPAVLSIGCLVLGFFATIKSI